MFALESCRFSLAVFERGMSCSALAPSISGSSEGKDPGTSLAGSIAARVCKEFFWTTLFREGAPPGEGEFRPHLSISGSCERTELADLSLLFGWASSLVPADLERCLELEGTSKATSMGTMIAMSSLDLAFGS